MSLSGGCHLHKYAHISLRKWRVQENRKCSIFYANAPVTQAITQPIDVRRTQALMQWVALNLTKYLPQDKH